MSDPRRRRFLSEEIDRIQEEKIETLRAIRATEGMLAKAQLLAKFNNLNSDQERMEAELSKLEED